MAVVAGFTGFGEIVVGIVDFDIEDFGNFFLRTIGEGDLGPNEDWIDATLGWGAGDLAIFSGHASWELVVDLLEVDRDFGNAGNGLFSVAFTELGIIGEVEGDFSGFVDVDLVG